MNSRTGSFRCAHCRWEVPLRASGTQHRNHCPRCLWSVHLDIGPGDRKAACGASMEPVAVSVRRDGEWTLIHRCDGCGVLHDNRIAGDDSTLALMRLAVRPIAEPPFPLEYLGQA